jgi:amino acid permease
MLSNKKKILSNKKKISKDKIEGYVFLSFLIIFIMLIFYFLPTNVTL